MARRIRDSGLESRAARGKLKPRGKPYFKAIGQGLHLGYRKGATEGKWVTRRYVGNQAYVVETIATADDIADADGINVLTFYQAQDRARAIVAQKVYSGPYRVKDAIADYLEFLGARGWETGYRVRKHILPKLGEMLVDELTTDTIRKWHRGMVKADARASQVSANRVLITLKAALNQAFKEGKIGSDIAWRRVEAFKGVDRCRDRYLSLAEVGRFLNACDPGFRPLARAALETGARYGELCRLTVGDFNPDAGTLHVRKSKTGIERHIILSDDGREFFEQLTVGRDPGDPPFGRVWKRDHQTRWMRLAVTAAKIIPPITFHGLRHTWEQV